jgi:hypothetical protein
MAEGDQSAGAEDVPGKGESGKEKGMGKNLENVAAGAGKEGKE